MDGKATASIAIQISDKYYSNAPPAIFQIIAGAPQPADKEKPFLSGWPRIAIALNLGAWHALSIRICQSKKPSESAETILRKIPDSSSELVFSQFREATL